MGDFLEVLLSVALVAVWVKPLAGYMTAVYMQLPHPLSRPFGKLERLIYRLGGVDPTRQMSWRSYVFCALAFNGLGFLSLVLLFTCQGFLPLNPQNFPGLPFDLAFNMGISFITGTNWQPYSGETQLSYLSQTMGISVQHFMGAATGMAAGVAFCRGIAVRQSHALGNFWCDAVRSILYILLPLSLVFGLVLVSQGVVQNYSAYTAYTSLEGVEGLIAQGPAALQTAIKTLGSNGGGFFATNAGHPFENPNAITNMLQLASILLVPVSYVYMAGMMMRDRRQGVMLLAAMTIIFLPLAALTLWQETLPNPKWDSKVIDVEIGNIEGKEVRFGVLSSAFFGAVSTATSVGANNAAYDSFAPLSGMVHMMFMQMGEVIFGGVGSGVYGMYVFVFTAVLMAGLMVGRTPEYMGKKLTPFDIKMITFALLLPMFAALLGTAIILFTEAGRSAVSNPGPHAFSQILYAFSTASFNNGAGMSGLAANQPIFNYMLGVCMLIGRYGLMICMLAVAGSFARKNIAPTTAGTLPTHTPLFIFFLVKVVVIMGVTNFIPALALGPIAEHMLMDGVL